MGLAMLVIRDEQMDVLARVVFERRVADHVREFFPDRSADLGDDGVVAHVRAGIAKAESYGLSHPAHVGQMVDLMLLFGRDFDTDPRWPWAGSILRDPAIDHPGTRMKRLCDAAGRALEGDGGAA